MKKIILIALIASTTLFTFIGCEKNTDELFYEISGTVGIPATTYNLNNLL